MSEGAEQDKSEKPTAFKLDRARKEGNVARGMDLGFFAALTAAVGFTWFASDRLTAVTGDGARRILAAVSVDATGGQTYAEIAALMVRPLLPVLIAAVGAVFALVLVLEFLQTGPVFSMKPLRFDFNRLNPAKGLKRVFSVRMLIETAKTVFKAALYIVVAGLAVRAAVEAAPALTSAQSLGVAVQASLSRLLAAACGAALLIVALDQGLARRDYLKRMRMSRRDIKREHRDREGDPRLRQKRKQLHGQFVQTSQSLKNLPGADMVIVNPVHFAVALRYDPAVGDAPVVVSRGSHALALRLRRMAFARSVPVIHAPALARRLYRGGALGRPIPEDAFREVADLYLSLDRNRRSGSLHD
ncbi:EscU/YscU/HrcU family type III secretion system export apparatus switch protein [Brevundimonas faecalis]|uniref:Flagellar biosynthetic protein FlhB n=1 Tax=Brevundimonas faecalis TaxID=947378 RepID=A0ABV2R7L3_9CAUL